MERPRLDNAIHRLQQIRWGSDPFNASHVVNFRQFLRTMALWATTLDRQDLWPFFSVVPMLTRTPINSEALVDRLVAENPILASIGRVRTRLICVWYLDWIRLQCDTLATVQAFDLPEPYEAAIQLFEGGGLIEYHKGEVVVGLSSFRFLRIEDYLTRTVE